MNANKKIRHARLKRRIAYFLLPHVCMIQSRNSAMKFKIYTKKWYQRSWKLAEVIDRPSSTAPKYLLAKYGTTHYIEINRRRIREARKAYRLFERLRRKLQKQQ